MEGAGINDIWTEDITRLRLLPARELRQWIVVVPNKCALYARKFVSAMARCTRNFTIAMPQYFEISDHSSKSYTDCLEEILSKNNPEILLCILPEYDTQTYSAIMKKLCIDRPVVSQVITARYLSDVEIKPMAIEVSIQMITKIGGIPWTIPIPIPGIMVVGYHVRPDEIEKSTYYRVMVASLDKQQSRWCSTVSAHTSGEELSRLFATNMVKALSEYQKVNEDALPSHIIVSRDGVDEGPVPFVLEDEVAHVQDAIIKFYNNVQPIKLGYIFINNKINKTILQDRNNPQPGMVVDDVVTNPMKYDFFLISQRRAQQGTVSPTLCSVIYNTLSLTPHQIYLLTSKLSHLYDNCKTTRSLPAPVEFAHRLAILVSQSIHITPTNPHLENRLYFL